ncbi:MAG: OmpA family protein [Deltaproteobacteria bacterium]|nr:OmpA family protein [Deltaproteobacteria bacterium]
MKRNFIFLGLFLIGIFVVISRAEAATNRFNITSAPATLPSDYATVLGSATSGKTVLGIFLQNDYMYRPLEVTVAGNRNQGVIDHLFVSHLGLSYGLFKFMDIEAMGSFAPYNRFQTPNTPAPGFTNETTLGDLFFRTRLRLSDKTKHTFGLSIIPFITAPIGNENEFMADNKVKGGVTVAIERQFGKVFGMALNLGTVIRENVSILDYNTKTLITSGLAAKIQWCKNLSSSVDVTSSTTANRPYLDHVTSPVDIMGAVQYAFGQSGFVLKASGGSFLTKGAGRPTASGNLALSFHTPLKKAKPLSLKHSIFFDVDSSLLSSDSSAVISTVASVFKSQRKARLIISQGYTDETGDKAYNQQLAQKRAQAVKDVLVIEHQIPYDKVAVDVVGEVPGLSKGDRQQNRRVDITIEIPSR